MKYNSFNTIDYKHRAPFFSEWAIAIQGRWYLHISVHGVSLTPFWGLGLGGRREGRDNKTCTPTLQERLEMPLPKPFTWEDVPEVVHTLLGALDHIITWWELT